MERNTEKGEKLEMHIVGPGIWRKTRKTWKIRHKLCTTWSEARNTEKGGKGKMQTVHLEYGEKH
jgi:hypothetical protein